MNAEQRADLRKLAEEATPGPWYSGSDWVTADLTFESVLLQLNSTGSAADWFDLGYIAAANPSTILQLLDYIETLERGLAHKQAQIDALMLEFCPEEMTEEQVAEWARHQVPAKGETE